MLARRAQAELPAGEDDLRRRLESLELLALFFGAPDDVGHARPAAPLPHAAGRATASARGCSRRSRPGAGRSTAGAPTRSRRSPRGRSSDGMLDRRRQRPHVRRGDDPAGAGRSRRRRHPRSTRSSPTRARAARSSRRRAAAVGRLHGVPARRAGGGGARSSATRSRCSGCGASPRRPTRARSSPRRSLEQGSVRGGADDAGQSESPPDRSDRMMLLDRAWTALLLAEGRAEEALERPTSQARTRLEDAMRCTCPGARTGRSHSTGWAAARRPSRPREDELDARAPVGRAGHRRPGAAGARHRRAGARPRASRGGGAVLDGLARAARACEGARRARRAPAPRPPTVRRPRAAAARARARRDLRRRRRSWTRSARRSTPRAPARGRRALQGVGVAHREREARRRLAAEGHSNRDIAQTLYVTPKTVEVHLLERVPQARHRLAPRAFIGPRAGRGARRWRLTPCSRASARPRRGLGVARARG